MNNNPNSERFNEIIEGKNSFAICLIEKPNIDTIAAGTALYLALSKLGKEVSIVCAGSLPQDTNVTGIDKISQTIGAGGDTLVVSFPYTEGSIDKVSYHIEGERFNLLIQPRPGFAKIATNQVDYRYSGGQSEVIITLDAPNLTSLGSIYTNNPDAFKGVDIINIDRHLTNANFGSLNIVEKQLSSTSEMVFSLLKDLRVEIDRDTATNLYTGIVAASNNFTSYSVNAQTFEACAQLLKLGAIKKAVLRPNNPRPAFQQPRFNNQQSARPQSRPSISQHQDRPMQSPSQPQPQSHMTHDEPHMQPQPESQSHITHNEPHMQSQPVSHDDSTSVQHMVEHKEEKMGEDSPDDWLKPKIFDGNDVVNH